MKKRILVVEDSEDDLLLLQMAMESVGLGEQWAAVRDGREALNYLSGKGQYARKPLRVPQLVLLDLKLPYLSGFEVLKWIRRRDGLRDLPVIVCSSSNIESDVNAAYALGADAYVMKPGYKELVWVVQQIKKYWLEMNRPPAGCQDWLSVVIAPANPPEQSSSSTTSKLRRSR